MSLNLHSEFEIGIGITIAGKTESFKLVERHLTIKCQSKDLNLGEPRLSSVPELALLI